MLGQREAVAPCRHRFSDGLIRLLVRLSVYHIFDGRESIRGRLRATDSEALHKVVCDNVSASWLQCQAVKMGM